MRGPEDPSLAVFERLERKRRPTPEDLDRLVRDVLSIARPGLSERARDLLGRWRRDGCRDPDLRLVEVLLTVVGSSTSAWHRLQLIGDHTPETAAMEAISCLFRGELQSAVDLAYAHGWFLDSLEGTEVLCYALMAAAFLEQYEQAEVVIDAWKRRFAVRSPEKYQQVLQVESRMAYMQGQYTRELSLLQDADALCQRTDLQAARTFLEPALVGAQLHCGDHDRVRRALTAWGDADDAPTSPLECFRNMVRVDVHLLGGRFDQAERAALGMRRFGEAIACAPIIAEASFYQVMSAPASRFGDALDDFRRLAYQLQLARYLDRLRVLERLTAGEAASLRDVRVEVRAREATERHPPMRIWLPKLEWVGADLYLDRVRGAIHMRGTPPRTLVSHPVLQQLLENIAARDGFVVGVDELFPRIWGAPFDPLRHEGKVHVSIHRLRRWLDRGHAGSGRLVEIRDGLVRFGPGADVRVLDLDRSRPAPAEPAVPTTRDRIVQCLSCGQAMGSSDLQRKLGISRSSLNQSLRVLVAVGRLLREGRSRATRYRAVPP